MTAAGKSRPCPGCGKPAAGNFCQHCGAPLGGRFCTECGAELPDGARFCNRCGTAAAGGGGGAPAAGRGAVRREAARATFGGSNLPWWIAGVAMFGLILAVGLSVARPSGPEPTPGGGVTGDPASGAAGVDLSSMTAREAAERLFDRVMRTASAGDSAGARAFVPMAVAAYERAQPLDLDGLLHVSMLQWVDRDFEAALSTARQLLEVEPDHLLGLAAAAEAAKALGRVDDTGRYYRHLLDVYDEQMADPRPEYEAHNTEAGLLVAMKRADAEAFLAGR